MAQPIVNAAKVDKPALEQILKKGDLLLLDDFDLLPTYSWDVTEILPNADGGLTQRAHMTFVGNDVKPLREHIRKLVEDGALKPGTIQRSNPFAIEVFFGHPGWTGSLIGYRISLAHDEYNFTTLRRHCDDCLQDGNRDDFVGPIIVHQSDADTIEVVVDRNKVTLNLLSIPEVPTRYAAFEAPGTMTFNFKSEKDAEYARNIAQHIIDKSTAYMDSVHRKFGFSKYRRPVHKQEEE